MGLNRILLHNLKKNLAKHFIILTISVITLVTAIAAISFERITLGIRTEQLAEMTLNEEIIITPENESDSERIMSLIENADNVERLVPKTVTDVYTDISDSRFTLYGVDYAVQNELSAIPILEGEISSSENNCIMISSQLAREHSLSVGDEVTLFIADKKERLSISAVCDENCALFDNYSTCLLADPLLAGKISGIGVNRIDVSIEKPELIDDTVTEISALLNGIDAEIAQKYDSSFYDSFVFTVVLALRIFVVFAVIMAVYLIYSLYRTLILEQSSEMAVLRTLGMTMKGYISFVLKQTLATYAIASVSAFFLSKLLIRIMLGTFIDYSGNADISFSPIMLAAVYSSFLIICIFSAAAGIYKQASIPVIEVLRAVTVPDRSRGLYMKVIGAVSLAVSILLYFAVGDSVTVLSISLVLALAAMIMLSGTAVDIIAAIVRRIPVSRYNVGLKQLGSLRSSYTLIFDLASFVIILFVISNSVSSDLTNSISKIYGDESIYTEVYSEISDDELESIAESIEADDVLILRKASADINGETFTIEAVPIESYCDREYESAVKEKVSHRALFERLYDDGAVIISSTAAKQLGVKKGDTVICGGAELYVKGIAATYENMGRMIYASYDTLGSIEYENSFDVILYRCDEPEKAIETVGERYAELSAGYSVQTVDDLFKANNERNQTVIRIVNMLSVFIGLAALVCLYSTVKICLQKKIGNYVIFRTVGADRAALTMGEIIESAVDSLANMIYALPFAFFTDMIVRSIISFYYGEGSSGMCSIICLLGITLAIEAAYIICKLILLKKELFKVNIVESIKQKAV